VLMNGNIPTNTSNAPMPPNVLLDSIVIFFRLFLCRLF
jgi:hypothetical protein